MMLLSLGEGIPFLAGILESWEWGLCSLKRVYLNFSSIFRCNRKSLSNIHYITRCSLLIGLARARLSACGQNRLLMGSVSIKSRSMDFRGSETCFKQCSHVSIFQKSLSGLTGVQVPQLFSDTTNLYRSTEVLLCSHSAFLERKSIVCYSLYLLLTVFSLY